MNRQMKIPNIVKTNHQSQRESTIHLRDHGTDACSTQLLLQLQTAFDAKRQVSQLAVGPSWFHRPEVAARQPKNWLAQTTMWPSAGHFDKSQVLHICYYYCCHFQQLSIALRSGCIAWWCFGLLAAQKLANVLLKALVCI
jgi:hypothetical protein